MDEILNGIQQIGIGVSDTKSVFNWYRKYLGFDILLFRDEATASLMTKYTKGKPERRDAYLSLNMHGGGGLEIWQFKDRKPKSPKKTVLLGDLGINAMKIRTSDVADTHSRLEKLNLSYLTEISVPTSDRAFFYFKDPWENLVQVVSDNYIFSRTKISSGGVMGAVIGVCNMERSIAFYSDLLGYSQIGSDEIVSLTFSNDDFKTERFRKVILHHARPKIGGFGELLGPTQIELIQALDRKPVKIYENRLWGDLGYIHICFDVQGMDSLREKAKTIGHSFTVDSANSFDMGEASGHFSYIEDPDGTLIEFVETHKVPILKILGIYLNLKNRNPYKTLPKWLVKTLRFHRVSKDLQ